MLPTSESGQAADVVARLLPPLPGFLQAAAGRQSFSHPPIASTSSSSVNGSSQQPSFFKQHERLGHERQQQQQQQAMTRPQAASSNNTRSRRRVPTADGSHAGPSSSSSSHTGRAPIDIVLSGISAGGIGAGAGGMVCVPGWHGGGMHCYKVNPLLLTSSCCLHTKASSALTSDQDSLAPW